MDANAYRLNKILGLVLGSALVLQVLHVIPHNLPAAYPSHLFGVICVALVKIRHVRGFKRRLIIEAQG
mgnify:CR=1 FL=1